MRLLGSPTLRSYATDCVASSLLRAGPKSAFDPTAPARRPTHQRPFRVFFPLRYPSDAGTRVPGPDGHGASGPWRHGVTSIELRPLRLDEVGGLSRLLWRAFENDPLFRYLFRSRWYAGRVVPLLFRATARDALRHGCIDGAVADGRPLAAAIWSSSGQIRPPTIRQIVAELPASLEVNRSARAKGR